MKLGVFFFDIDWAMAAFNMTRNAAIVLYVMATTLLGPDIGSNASLRV